MLLRVTTAFLASPAPTILLVLSPLVNAIKIESLCYE